MDPEENQRQQLENAKAILKIVDQCPHDGHWKREQLEELASHAQWLAELVVELHSWNRSKAQRMLANYN